MLVLTRKANETIVINSNIRVTIVKVRGEGSKAQVKVGIEAPPGVPVNRLEIQERIDAGEPSGLKGGLE